MDERSSTYVLARRYGRPLLPLFMVLSSFSWLFRREGVQDEFSSPDEPLIGLFPGHGLELWFIYLKVSVKSTLMKDVLLAGDPETTRSQQP
jgi:hypothetical protein